MLLEEKEILEEGGIRQVLLAGVDCRYEWENEADTHPDYEIRVYGGIARGSILFGHGVCNYGESIR